MGKIKLIKLFWLVFLLLHQTINFAQSNAVVELSQQLLQASKTDKPTNLLVNQLANFSKIALKNALQTNNQKKVFWLNIYNAYVQMLLPNNTDILPHKHRFFTKKIINIAGVKLSLDDIEHGMLRRSKAKWGLGYVNKLLIKKFEKELRVDTLDNRIHFALNCGANSCPPILFYEVDRVQQQLQVATASYLQPFLQSSTTNNIVLPKFFSWFRGDFGGKKGMRIFLINNGNKNITTVTNISFAKYNWKLKPKYFWQD